MSEQNNKTRCITLQEKLNNNPILNPRVDEATISNKIIDKFLFSHGYDRWSETEFILTSGNDLMIGNSGIQNDQVISVDISEEPIKVQIFKNDKEIKSNIVKSSYERKDYKKMDDDIMKYVKIFLK